MKPTKHLEELRSQVAITQLQQNGKEITPTTISETANSLKPADVGDKVLPHFIVTQLPVGLAGLLIAAIFAAAMSSMDTSLNSSATLYLCDIHQRYLNPAATDRESMRVLYSATVIMGVAGTFAALAMINLRSALDAWWKLLGYLYRRDVGLVSIGSDFQTSTQCSRHDSSHSRHLADHVDVAFPDRWLAKVVQWICQSTAWFHDRCPRDHFHRSDRRFSQPIFPINFKENSY